MYLIKLDKQILMEIETLYVYAPFPLLKGKTLSINTVIKT